MVEFYKSHIYLCSQIFSLIVYLVGFALLLKYRKSILIASILALPQAFYALILVPVYWNPNRINFLGVGLEDFLFSFMAGGLVWIGVLLFFGKRIEFEFTFRKVVFRYLLCSFFGISITIVLFFAGVRNIINPFTTMFFLCVIILVYNFRLWPIFLFESLAAFFVYWMGLKITFIIWPEIPQMWTWENLWGIKLLGIPIEELIWAFLYGGSWSLTIAFILGVKLKKSCIQLITL